MKKPKTFESGDQFGELNQKMASQSPHLWLELGSSSTQTHTECSSSIGIAVALIEGMLATARVLCRMNLAPSEIQEALKDLSACLEIKEITSLNTEMPTGRIIDQACAGRDV